MKLDAALLCIECEEVFSSLENPTSRCPACGDGSTFPLSRALMSRRDRRVTRDALRRVAAVCVHRPEVAA